MRPVLASKEPLPEPTITVGRVGAVGASIAIFAPGSLAVRSAAWAIGLRPPSPPWRAALTRTAIKSTASRPASQSRRLESGSMAAGSPRPGVGAPASGMAGRPWARVAAGGRGRRGVGHRGVSQDANRSALRRLFLSARPFWPEIWTHRPAGPVPVEHLVDVAGGDADHAVELAQRRRQLGDRAGAVDLERDRDGAGALAVALGRGRRDVGDLEVARGAGGEHPAQEPRPSS